MNTINHDSISEAIKELNKVGNINLAKKLERILKYNEIKKRVGNNSDSLYIYPQREYYSAASVKRL